jgi:hypothetical protein
VRTLPPFFALLMLLPGCCVSSSTSVRNETGRDIHLIVYHGSQALEGVTIRASSTGKCGGITAGADGMSADSWVVTAGRERFTFADVSPIATLPGAFTSSSRFTGDFPCKRITRHVRLASDMTIHADRVLGYTESEPSQFPIHYTKKEQAK